MIDRALVPGWVDDSTHLLLDVDATAVEPDRASWHTVGDGRVALLHGARRPHRRPRTTSSGRRASTSGGAASRSAASEVAAVWAGGAQSVLEQVVDGLRRFTPTAHQPRRVGVMEQAVRQARAVVDATAQRLPELDGEALVRETAVARTAVVWACEQVLDEATRIVGPAGLSGTARLARTVADLTIYVRQHHLDLTLESLGRDALRDREPAG